MQFIQFGQNKGEQSLKRMQESGSEIEKKSSGKWKKTEHDRFMKGLQKFGRNWSQIQKFVKTRTLPQVRSHAQKLFMSMSNQEIRAFQEEQARRQADFCTGKGIYRSSENHRKSENEGKIKIEEPQEEEQVVKKEQDIVKIEAYDNLHPKVNQKIPQRQRQGVQYPTQIYMDYSYHVPIYNMPPYETPYPLTHQPNLMTMPMILNPSVLKQLVQEEDEQNNLKIKK